MMVRPPRSIPPPRTTAITQPLVQSPLPPPSYEPTHATNNPPSNLAHRSSRPQPRSESNSHDPRSHEPPTPHSPPRRSQSRLSPDLRNFAAAALLLIRPSWSSWPQSWSWEHCRRDGVRAGARPPGWGMGWELARQDGDRVGARCTIGGKYAAAAAPLIHLVSFLFYWLTFTSPARVASQSIRAAMARDVGVDAAAAAASSRRH